MSTISRSVRHYGLEGWKGMLGREDISFFLVEYQNKCTEKKTKYPSLLRLLENVASNVFLKLILYSRSRYTLRYWYCCGVYAIALPLICYSSFHCGSLSPQCWSSDWEWSWGIWMNLSAIISINNQVLSRTSIHFKSLLRFMSFHGKDKELC